MAKYFEKETLIREIISDMAMFIGDADAVQRHDEQCNYAISCIENAPVAEVAPIVHGQWRKLYADTKSAAEAKQIGFLCSKCMFKRDIDADFGRAIACPNCGADMREIEYETN